MTGAMLAYVILAVSDVFWGSLFSAIALVSAAWIARGNAKKITSIDDAVNHKEHGMPTLVQRVVDQDERDIKVAEDLAEFRKWMEGTFEAFAKDSPVIIPDKMPPVAPVEIAMPSTSPHPNPDPAPAET